MSDLRHEAFSLSLSGLIASPGQAYGSAYILEDQTLDFSRLSIGAEEVSVEVARFREALAAVVEQLEALQQRVADDKKELFTGYVLLLDDPELQDAVVEEIRDRLLPAEVAVESVFEAHAEAISKFQDPYLRERASDVRDLGRRILRRLLSIPEADGILFDEDVILIANDLTPAQFVQLDTKKIRAIVTDHGGETSHTSILARSLGIPAIVGTSDATRRIPAKGKVLLDAIRNRIILEPSAQELKDYYQWEAERSREALRFEEIRGEAPVTADGHRIRLHANIGLPFEVDRAMQEGAEGIGLFRTEFLFMDRSSVPNEEEQFRAYRQVLEGMKGRPATIRTMDVGGDKDLPYLSLPDESNPYLGCRGIRISLRRTDLFQTQLRALLRASVYGKLRIMFPMVSSLEEVQDIRSHIEDVKADLRSQGLAFSKDFEVGIMVETPAAVWIADHLIQHLDFFSVGTNDLTQYTLAVDRGNTQIADLYQALSPAVLRAIKQVVDVAHAHGKSVSVCGELAGHKLGSLLLVGLGLKDLSMSATALGRVKYALRQTRFDQLRELAENALKAPTTLDVQRTLEPLEAFYLG